MVMRVALLDIPDFESEGGPNLFTAPAREDSMTRLYRGPAVPFSDLMTKIGSAFVRARYDKRRCL